MGPPQGGMGGPPQGGGMPPMPKHIQQQLQRQMEQMQKMMQQRVELLKNCDHPDFKYAKGDWKGLKGCLVCRTLFYKVPGILFSIFNLK